ncbi:MAG TPA: hypothetical protein VHE35_35480 [Kofleriaceae bacterium]|nr:hypothetical protein [Kofleriaceae bacterium]
MSSMMLRAALASPLLAGCVDQLPPIDETTSLHVEVTAPTDLGSRDTRLGDDVDSADIAVTAIGADGQPDPAFAGDVQVYVQYLGSLTPALDMPPLQTISMSGGTGTATVALPPVYGPTVIWVQDDREGGDYPTGVTPTFWFREPKTRDLQQPRDEAGLAALSVSPLQNKQVTVMGSRHGAAGKLVVTSIYSQGFTVDDVMCADENGTPPCTTGDYDHMLVFSFSRPRDAAGRGIETGQFIDGYAGAVTEFNGLTEMGFPQTFASTPASDPDQADLRRLPPPVTIQSSWLSTKIEFERNESGVVQVVNGTVCPLDSDYEMYKQWKLDIGAGCSSPINVITSGVVDFDPTTKVGMPMAKVVGVLRPVNIGTFNVWIIYPRDAGDVSP